MRTLTVVLSLVLAAVTSFADQPSRESETESLYVLRAYVQPGSPNAYQGIFRYDPVAKTYAPFAAFNYYWLDTSYGSDNARLSATADRIIVQSSAYYEFEVSSGRLLRRYDSNDAAQGGWAFQGVVVTEEQARTLGIASGTYGFPLCTYFVLSDPVESTCAPRQFPGYSAPALRPYSVLLRRSLDPADTTLTAAKVIGAESSMPYNGPPHAVVALDTTRHQFWTWGAAGRDGARQWATLPISGGTIGDPTPLAVASPAPIMDVNSLTFHEASQMLFDVVLLPDSEELFLKQPTPNAATVSLLDSVFPPGVAQVHTDAVASVPIALPARYVQVIPAIGELNGLSGTFWRSDVWLYNPSETDIAAGRAAAADIGTTPSGPRLRRIAQRAQHSRRWVRGRRRDTRRPRHRRALSPGGAAFRLQPHVY